MLFKKIKNFTNEEMIINKGFIRVNEYRKIIDINDSIIELLNLTIRGQELKIRILTKEYIIIVGKIKEIIFKWKKK